MTCSYKNKNNIFKTIYVNEFNRLIHGPKPMFTDLYKRVFLNSLYRNDNTNNKD